MKIIPRSFSVSRRFKWKVALSALSLVLFALDQKRRSKRALKRFIELYSTWYTRESSKDFLRSLHSNVKQLLAQHDAAALRDKSGIEASGVDLAIAGGGFKSLYAMGAAFALQHAGFKIERASGASAGAYLAVMLAGNRYQLDDVLKENLLGWCDCCVQAVCECKTLLLAGVWSYMSAELTKRLKGWLPEPHTVFLSVTTLGVSGLTEHITTNFESRQDLEQTVNASMAIPVVLCDGLTYPWRGYRAIDGGFGNNCPVSAFRSRFQATDAKESDQMSEDIARLIVKVDCNWISGMPIWRKLWHVVYAPSDICKHMLLEGVKDMLAILSNGQSQLNGITLIRPQTSLEKREFSYQLFPGREHVRRFRSGKSLV